MRCSLSSLISKGELGGRRHFFYSHCARATAQLLRVRRQERDKLMRRFPALKPHPPRRFMKKYQ